MKEENKKISVCMLLPFFPPDYSGAGRQALKLSQQLMKLGVSVTVVTTCRGKWPGFEKVQGMNVIRFPALGPEFIKTFFFNAGSLPFLFFNINQFDIIHLHSLNGMYSAVILKWLCRKKVLYKMTNFGMDDPLSLQKQPGGKVKFAFFKAVDSVVAISSDCRNAFHQTKLEREKCSLIPNGVDVEKFKPMDREDKRAQRKKMGINEDELVLTFLGQISRRKGIHKIVAAMKNFPMHQFKLRCFLIGPVSDKSYFSELQKKIIKYSLEKYFQFPGMVEQSQKYLQVSDIFIFPSEKEGMPNALLEAMSCGIPCVASNISGCADVIGHGHNGFLFEKDNIIGLAESIKMLAEDRDLRKKIGTNARQTICEKYSLERISNLYLNLYQKLLYSSVKD